MVKPSEYESSFGLNGACGLRRNAKLCGTRMASVRPEEVTVVFISSRKIVVFLGLGVSAVRANPPSAVRYSLGPLSTFRWSSMYVLARNGLLSAPQPRHARGQLHSRRSFQAEPTLHAHHQFSVLWDLDARAGPQVVYNRASF